MVALWEILIEPEYVPVDDALKRTVTVRDCPGESVNEPPPLAILNPMTPKLKLTEPARVPVDVGEFEIVIFCSPVCPRIILPKSIELGVTEIIADVGVCVEPLNVTTIGLNVPVAL